MQLAPSKSRALEFPIGESTYVVPPCGITAGMKLAELLTTPEKDLAKVKMRTVDLFKLAVGAVWDQMTADNVPYTEQFRVGMACLAREQALLQDSGPDRWDNADEIAAAVWDSGIDPNQLAVYMTARQQQGDGQVTPVKTPKAAASTTRTPASGSGTTGRRRQPVKKQPSRPSGASSEASGT